MKAPVSPSTNVISPHCGLKIDRLLAILHLGKQLVRDGRYHHWNTFRHLSSPRNASSTEWWAAVKFARRAAYRPLPLYDKQGHPFVFATPDPASEMLHQCDRNASGAIQAPAQVTNPGTRDTYRFRSLTEEAIASSQLEGASIARKAAKAMLREGRKPMTRSEQMIMNNYNAMQFVRRFVGQPLTTSMILELHTILMEETLEDPSTAGRFRAETDNIVVEDEVGHILHTPPNASELPTRLRQLCDFANFGMPDAQASSPSPEWIHPVIRAILLHFIIGHDHPFVDGNGRTARALFYWAMASHGYWLAEFVSISRTLKKAKASYARAFLYTETDENDTTYFVLNQLRVFLCAIDDLHEYLSRKAKELQRTELQLRHWTALRARLNDRQLALMSKALKHPDTIFTIESHRRSHGVAYETARTDLRTLAQHGLLREQKRGRAFWQ